MKSSQKIGFIYRLQRCSSSANHKFNSPLNTIVALALGFFFIVTTNNAKALELNAEIFSALNLEFKGLEKVKSLHEAGKDKEAAEALLDYFRNRKGIIIPGLNLNNITISANEQKWADQALEHKLYVSS